MQDILGNIRNQLQQQSNNGLNATQEQLYSRMKLEWSIIDNVLTNLTTDVQSSNYNQNDKKNTKLLNDLGQLFDEFSSADNTLFQSLTEERGNWARELGYSEVPLSSRSRLNPIINKLQQELSHARTWADTDFVWSSHKYDEFDNYITNIHNIAMDLSMSRQNYITSNEDDL